MINALIDAVDLGTGEGEVFTAGGDTYAVRVTRLDGNRRPEEWRRSGSPYWDIDDPLIARVLDLTEENSRLRQVVAFATAEKQGDRRSRFFGRRQAIDGELIGPG